jgi:hypothetical protein
MKPGKRIFFTALLFLPVVIFYAGYLFNKVSELHPSGFIQYDNVGYAAYARQYLDASSTQLFYSNPFNDSPHYPAIYFQTQNLFLALMMKAGISPGFSICIFSLIFCLLSIFMILKIYDTVYVNSPNRKLSIWLLVWGGGLLVLAGLVTIPFQPPADLETHLFFLDPARGWWGLNFGRSLIFGVESYYHFLFFTSVYFILKKKWVAVCLLSLVLCFSHPFTGVHLVLFILLWAAIEKLVVKNKTVPWWFLLAMLLLLAADLYYYLIYLPSFPDHKSVAEQYAANWNYRFYHFIPAYIIVFSIFALSVYIQSLKKFLANPFNRLFLCLAIISFLLSNHELFMKPMQPIHFARGYEWTAYFLMGVPALHYVLERLKRKRVLLYLFVGVFLLDNFLWIGNFVIEKRTAASIGHITDEEIKVLETIKTNSDEETLIIGRDKMIPYLSLAYTKAYSWISHPYTTSFVEKKSRAYMQYLETGQMDSSWFNRKLIFVVNIKDSVEAARLTRANFPYTLLIETPIYKVVAAKPINQ